MADRWKSLPENERAEFELLSAEDKRIREIQLMKYESFCRENPQAMHHNNGVSQPSAYMKKKKLMASMGKQYPPPSQPRSYSSNYHGGYSAASAPM